MTKNDTFNLYGVILAGGAGTRLWPLSREFYPKQLLRLFGDKTLIQQTFNRLKKIIPSERIYVVTTRALKDDIYFQLRKTGFKKENFLIEPTLRNTAPTIGFAAQKIFNFDKDALLIICPSDHLIVGEAGFARSIKWSVRSARSGYLTVLGIVPDYPSSDYGYIKVNAVRNFSGVLNSDRSNLKCNFIAEQRNSISNEANPKSKIKNSKLRLSGWPVKQFVEKPDKDKAEEFIKKGYLWNSGIFVFSAKNILESIENYLPDVYRVLKIGAAENFGEKFAVEYANLKPISLDNGIMEKAENIWLIPAEFQWKDIGSWKAFYDILPKDSENNVLLNKVFQKECKNSLLYSNTHKRVVAAVGLNDLVVIDTEDAVLIADKNRTAEIKKVLEELKNNNLPQYREHPTVYRPWGYYTVLEEGEGFKVKKIRVMPKNKLSLQTHKMRSEHWVVLSGKAKVQLNDKIITLRPNENIGIPAGARHCLENAGKEPLDIVEIQSGSYLGEDDIVRFDDKYGRIEKC